MFVKDILYKIFLVKKSCPFCGTASSKLHPLCPKCTNIILNAKKQEFCRKCGKFIVKYIDKNVSLNTAASLFNDQICQECLMEGQFYDIARGVTLYEGIIKEKIYQFKYYGKRSLASVMAKLMVDRALTFTEYNNIDCVIPVPISMEKLKIRRYNQAYLLAKEIGKIMNLSILSDNLIRIIDTPAQSKLGREARRENLYGAFQVLNAEDFLGKKVLLVDDILTTGSTINECSRILKEKGASEVVVLTLVTGKIIKNGGSENEYSKL